MSTAEQSLKESWDEIEEYLIEINKLKKENEMLEQWIDQKTEWIGESKDTYKKILGSKD